MSKYRIQQFPDSRLATMDICEIGKQKHHVTGLIELDVSESRKKIAEYNKVHQEQISFSAWLLAVIAQTLQKHDRASSYLIGKNKQIIFEDINISILVEKEINGSKVPIPLLLEKAQELSIEAISKLIQDAKWIFRSMLTPPKRNVFVIRMLPEWLDSTDIPADVDPLWIVFR